MRRKSLIVLLLLAVVFVMASTSLPLLQRKRKSVQRDSVAMNDSVRRDTNNSVIPDTTQMDSLQLAVYHHNKAIDDSIHLDSLNRKKKNGIDAPVVYSASDSLVYDAATNTAYLFGSSKVKYESMDLASDKIYMSLDSSLVHATGSRDTTAKDGLKNKPVFKMGGSEYESDTMAFNFKTKKGLIENVRTQQEE